ncbi:MAG: DEAD/DEAH box helicase, partial [Deltaproteobacteria bacterium]
MSLSAEEAEEPIEEAAPQPSDYVADVRFEDLPLSEEVLAGIRERGYERPTPVQARCIEPALKGRDLSVRSKTGTGKTAAFGIPLIETVEPRGQLPQAVVLAPTRELANQVAEELAALGKHKSVRVLSIIGGASMQAQLDALARGVDIVVGTPGRVLDHIRRGTLDLSQVKVRVLDEADEMLSMGFLEEVTSVLNACPEEAQTLLFSATLPEDLGRIVARYMKDPESILLSGDEFTVEGIENRLYETRDDYPKPRNLLYLLEMEDPDSAIIFCNTRDDTALVTAVLNRHGLPAALLNSDLSQKEREKAMQRIKSGEIRFLVATDLAARGIDISDLSHVVNYSLPEDPAVYMHRVGRTGRIGKKGTALS